MIRDLINAKMKIKKISTLLFCLIIGIVLNCLMAQPKDPVRNYTFAVSNSAKDNIVYVSTVFCWQCSSNSPCNGILYGKNTSTPCDFLAKWALSVFKKERPEFDGKEATVNCLTESLSMYNYSNEKSIEKDRDDVINNYKNKLHKTVIVVSFPLCME